MERFPCGGKTIHFKAPNTDQARRTWILEISFPQSNFAQKIPISASTEDRKKKSVLIGEYEAERPLQRHLLHCPPVSRVELLSTALWSYCISAK
jgi:hypothetical protein